MRIPLTEVVKGIWGMAGKPVTPEAFYWMKAIVTGQFFEPKGTEARA